MPQPARGGNDRCVSIERSAVFQQNIDLSFLHSVAGSDYSPVFSSPNTYIYWNMVVIAEYNYFQPMASTFQYIGYTQCIYLTCLAYAGVGTLSVLLL